MAKKTVALFILDGFGYCETSQSNAIAKANTPTWDRLWGQCPHNLVDTSGQAVGLPDGQMGNSEVGHMNLGAGRIVYQNLTKIDKAIADGDFFDNRVLGSAVDQAVAGDKSVHILGLLSAGGVHSHEDHLIAMIELAAQRGARRVYVHAFLDGRDTPPRSAKGSIEKLEAACKKMNVGRIASLIGRYYAMDRDQRWSRIQKAYDLLTRGVADNVANSAQAALSMAYEQGHDDEFCPASWIDVGADGEGTIGDGDAVIFMNFRPDRARQLTRALTDAALDAPLCRQVLPAIVPMVTLTQYAKEIDTPCAYPPETLVNTLGEYLAAQGKTQLRIAETEKYAHVTFFFNGGVETPFTGEERLLVPSPEVATYDLKPEMSAHELTDQLLEAIESQAYDVIICNYANGDMVGHTGKMAAAIKAVETLDHCLARVSEALLRIGGECLITADHGNVELMVDPVTGHPLTSHTTEPVPLVYVGQKTLSLKRGRLADIAPTLLELLELPVPKEMTGSSLFERGA